MKRVLIVGHSPSRSHPDKVLRGTRSGVRLEEWLLSWGLSWDDCDLVNAWTCPEKTAHTPGFLFARWDAYDCILALGKEVQAVVEQMGTRRMVRLPHPSGRNRLFNDPGYEARLVEIKWTEISLCLKYPAHAYSGTPTVQPTAL